VQRKIYSAAYCSVGAFKSWDSVERIRGSRRSNTSPLGSQRFDPLNYQEDENVNLTRSHLALVRSSRCIRRMALKQAPIFWSATA